MNGRDVSKILVSWIDGISWKIQCVIMILMRKNLNEIVEFVCDETNSESL